MRRTLAVAAAATLAACSSTRHTFTDDAPGGIPKAARAHCRTEAQALADANGAEELSPLVRVCLDAVMRADCAMEMLRKAEDLERARKQKDPFFFRFPGAWDRDTVEEETDALRVAACENVEVFAAALTLFHGIRNAQGGRIPWPDRGWGAPSRNRCADCK